MEVERRTGTWTRRRATTSCLLSREAMRFLDRAKSCWRQMRIARPRTLHLEFSKTLLMKKSLFVLLARQLIALSDHAVDLFLNLELASVLSFDVVCESLLASLEPGLFDFQRLHPLLVRLCQRVRCSRCVHP